MTNDLLYQEIAEKAKEIKSLLVEDQTDKAILKVLDFGSNYSFGFPDFKDEVVLISNGYRRLKKHEQNGLLSFQEATIENNKIIQSIISYVDKIENFNRTDLDRSQLNITKSIKYEEAKNIFFSTKSIINAIKEDKAISVVEKVSKTYKNNNVFKLDRFDLTMNPREITGVIGENAAGKTTLLKIIAGIITPSSGQIRYPLLTTTENSWYHIKSQIAYIPQSLKEWHGSIINSLHFSAAIKNIKGEKNLREVNWILERLRLTEYKDFNWHEISGGYKMRFELARALISKPKLLILDEPLAHLDINTQTQFLDDLREITNSNLYPISVIVSSQHIHEIERVCDSLCFFKNGKLEFKGSLEELELKTETNVFELTPLMNIQSFLKIIHSIPVKKYKINGDVITLYFPIYYLPEIFLSDINKLNINFDYFRDITKSTKKMFE